MVPSSLPDNGTIWNSVNSGLPRTYVRSFTVKGTSLFAGTDGGVFLSTDNGKIGRRQAASWAVTLSMR